MLSNANALQAVGERFYTSPTSPLLSCRCPLKTWFGRPVSVKHTPYASIRRQLLLKSYPCRWFVLSLAVVTVGQRGSAHRSILPRKQRRAAAVAVAAAGNVIRRSCMRQRKKTPDRWPPQTGSGGSRRRRHASTQVLLIQPGFPPKGCVFALL